ncbi:MAG: response regulator, partial [Candidatus Aminicenantes bacterium]|nr:response regulator [Candidatus Aminicenantes bacterium]
MDKLLLVDDEKVFLQSLKTGLKKLENVFQTDICFSVNEAIKNINKNEYGLVITDLRMPKKDGIDLLLYLNKINFRGTSKIMSAHNTEESLKKIKHLGFIDVIAKPFDLDWFENMIVEFFKEKNSSDRNLGEVNAVIRDICRKSPDGSSILFESIDLLSIMQVVNVDKRSATLSIDNNGNTGFVHFFEGDIVNAEYESLKIEDAILKLIETKESNISIKKLNKKVKRIIEIPFVEFMTGIIKKSKSSEEKSEDEAISNLLIDDAIKDEDKIIKNNSKEEEMSLKDVLLPLQNEVNGLKVSAIFGKDGLPLAMSNPANLDVDAFSAKFAMVSA